MDPRARVLIIIIYYYVQLQENYIVNLEEGNYFSGHVIYYFFFWEGLRKNCKMIAEKPSEKKHKMIAENDRGLVV